MITKTAIFERLVTASAANVELVAIAIFNILMRIFIVGVTLESSQTSTTINS